MHIKSIYVTCHVISMMKKTQHNKLYASYFLAFSFFLFVPSLAKSSPEDEDRNNNGAPTLNNDGSNTSDILNFVLLDPAINLLLSQINHSISTEDYLSQSRENWDRIENIIDNHDGSSSDLRGLEAGSWGNVIADTKFKAKRRLLISNHDFQESEGSNSNLKVMDYFSAEATLGYLQTLESGIQAVPSFFIGGSYKRSFRHIKPVELGESGSIPWKKLSTPFMEFLPKIFFESADVLGEDGQDTLSIVLEHLKYNEALIITDHITSEQSLSVRSPMEALFNLSIASGYMNFISAGFGNREVEIKKTTIIRKKDGIYVHVNSKESDSSNFNFGINYLLNLFTLNTEEEKSSSTLNVYKIPDPSLVKLPEEDLSDSSSEDEKKKFITERKNLSKILKLAIRNNDQYYFKNYFSPNTKVHHELVTNSNGSEFLKWKNSGFQESHFVNIKVPEKNKNIKIYVSRKGSIMGDTGWYDWFFRILRSIEEEERILRNWGLKIKVPSRHNPSETPFGEARWRIASTQIDYTKKSDTEEKAIGIVQEFSGGWNNSETNTISTLNNFVRNLHFLDIRLNLNVIDSFKRKYGKMESYRMESTVNIFQSGLNKIKNLILRSSEKKLYNLLLEAYGHGEEYPRKIGKEKYTDFCIYAPAPSGGFIFSDANKDRYSHYKNHPKANCTTKNLNDIFRLQHKFPKKGMKKQAKWNTKLLYALSREMPGKAFLNFLSRNLNKEDYDHSVNVSGYLKGNKEAAGKENAHFFQENLVRSQRKETGGWTRFYSKELGIPESELKVSNSKF